MRRAVGAFLHVRVGDRDNVHPGGARRGDPGGGVLEDQAALRVGPEIPGRQQEDIGRGLAAADLRVVAGDNRGEDAEPLPVRVIFRSKWRRLELVATAMGMPCRWRWRLRRTAPGNGSAPGKSSSSIPWRASRYSGTDRGIPRLSIITRAESSARSPIIRDLTVQSNTLPKRAATTSWARV